MTLTCGVSYKVQRIILIKILRTAGQKTLNRKKPNLMIVNCNLKDCTFWVSRKEFPELAFCKHPEIEFHRNDSRCPLYRMDWLKKAPAAEEFIAKRMKGA